VLTSQSDTSFGDLGWRYFEKSMILKSRVT
jgi:hypothetical protein